MKTFKEITEQLSEPISPADINVKIGKITVNDKYSGAMLIPYKTAKVDVDRLNKVCGALWKNRYYRDGQNLCCGISIYFEELNEWIERINVGTPSEFERVKGEYSDAFKRAGFQWGIGSELLKFPAIFINWPRELFIRSQRTNRDRSPIYTITKFNAKNYSIVYDGPTYEDGIIIYHKYNKNIIWTSKGLDAKDIEIEEILKNAKSGEHKQDAKTLISSDSFYDETSADDLEMQEMYSSIIEKTKQITNTKNANQILRLLKEAKTLQEQTLIDIKVSTLLKIQNELKDNNIESQKANLLVIKTLATHEIATLKRITIDLNTKGDAMELHNQIEALHEELGYSQTPNIAINSSKRHLGVDDHTACYDVLKLSKYITYLSKKVAEKFTKAPIEKTILSSGDEDDDFNIG